MIPHSKTGIASFVTGILNLSGLAVFLLYTNYYLDKSFTPETIIDAVFSSIAMGVVFIAVLSAGFLLGIISLFQKNTKKLFGILGLCLSVISVIVFVLFVLASMLMSPGM